MASDASPCRCASASTANRGRAQAAAATRASVPSAPAVSRGWRPASLISQAMATANNTMNARNAPSPAPASCAIPTRPPRAAAASVTREARLRIATVRTPASTWGTPNNAAPSQRETRGRRRASTDAIKTAPP